MREIEVLRNVQKREARKAMGKHPLSPSYLRGHVLQGSQEADHFALPLNIDDLSDVQNPTTGAFYFLVGFSIAGGDDIIGP